MQDGAKNRERLRAAKVLGKAGLREPTPNGPPYRRVRIPPPLPLCGRPGRCRCFAEKRIRAARKCRPLESAGRSFFFGRFPLALGAVELGSELLN